MNFYTTMTSSLYIIHCDILRITNYGCITFEDYLTLKKGSDVNAIKTNSEVAMCQTIAAFARRCTGNKLTQNTERLSMGNHVVLEVDPKHREAKYR
jgi:hypothetical protein